MGNGGIESTTEREEVEEEQTAESYSRVSESRISILEKEAEMRIEDQKETLDILRNQASRLETIKIGVIAAVLLFGLSGGVEATAPSLAEWLVSFIWFIIMGLVIVSSNIYARNTASLFNPFILDQRNSNNEYRVGDDLVEELLELTSDYSNEGLKDLERKADRISDNKKQIQALERRLRLSHVALFFILVALLIIGLPNTPLLEAFRLVS